MKIIKKLSACIIALSLFIACSSCSKSGSNGYNSPPPGGTPAPGAVQISGMAFTPSTITVKKGTKITWTNKDGYNHTVTADDGSTFNSGNLSDGGNFSFTPSVEGTINYHCSIHQGMKAKIVVTQ